MADQLTSLIPQDASAATRMLGHLFGDLEALEVAAKIEIRLLHADEGHSKSQNFDATAAGIQEAIAFALEQNRQGWNVYVGANPRAPIVADNQAAGAAQVLCATALFVDADTELACKRVAASPLRYSFVVQTGTKPERRAHFWWRLDEPAYNMTAVREAQIRLAEYFETDKAIVDAARIMRLAGTISWPTAKKVERGYRTERVGLKDMWDGELQDPVEFEAVLSLIPERAPPPDAPQGLETALDAFRLGRGGRSFDRVVELLRASHAEGAWHESVRAAVATMLGWGLNDDAIHSIVLAHGRVEHGFRDKDVQRLIDDGRRRWSRPHVEFVDPAEPGDGPEIVSAAEFVAGFTPPDFLVDRILQRRYCYTLTGHAGTGKTTLAMLIAMCVASGRPFAGHESDPGRVCFLAGENPDDVRARVIICAEQYGVDLTGLDLHFVSGTFDIAADMGKVAERADALGGFDLIIVDTLTAYFPGDDENSNAQMGAFAEVIRALTTLPGGPCVLALAHPTKTSTRDTLMPKGGANMTNLLDGNLTLWAADENIIEFHWTRKIRGPGFDPITLEMRASKSERVVDRKGRELPSVVAWPIDEARAEERDQQARSDENQVLLSLRTKDSLGGHCRTLGWVRSNGQPQKTKLQRVLKTLQQDGLAFYRRKQWHLTKDGKTEAEIIENMGGKGGFYEQ